MNWPGAIASPKPSRSLFIGDSGSSKTHLLTGLVVAACRKKRRVRFVTDAALINELVESRFLGGTSLLAVLDPAK
jgi:DNA replication protein DnaC